MRIVFGGRQRRTSNQGGGFRPRDGGIRGRTRTLPEAARGRETVSCSRTSNCRRSRGPSCISELFQLYLFPPQEGEGNSFGTTTRRKVSVTVNLTGSGPRYSPSTWQADGMPLRTKREGLSRTSTWREAVCFPRSASRANFAIDQRPFRRRAITWNVSPEISPEGAIVTFPPYFFPRATMTVCTSTRSRSGNSSQRVGWERRKCRAPHRT